MWIYLLILGIASINAQNQQFSSPCLASFDQMFRKCFQDNGNFQLDVIFSLITNGTSGPLPSNTNRANLLNRVCGVRTQIDTCVNPLPEANGKQQQCSDREKLMMDSTIQSTSRAIASLCGVQPEMPACLGKFDTRFRTCMTQNQINPEFFFKLLGNTTEGLQMTYDQLKNVTCVPQTQKTIVQCASTSLQQLNTECTKQEQYMVGQTLQNMMASYQSVCSGQSLLLNGIASPCMQKFEVAMDKCAMDTTTISMQDLMTVLMQGKAPPGREMNELNGTICKNFKQFQQCGKRAIKESQCKGRDLLIAEGTFANVFITAGAFCHDTSMPGACMLTLQAKLSKCFGEVGLDENTYVGNVTTHKGALLGATRTDAETYCAKRKELYVCMKRIMHQCPGAEQTMTLTGFDLASMERAVNVLCLDIDEYLIGLKCFEKPTSQSIQCMDDMSQSITSLSAQELSRGLSLNNFFKTFCDIRIKHVKCDTSAWSTCDPKAIELKRKFECHLIPTKCHQLIASEVDEICPSDSQVKPHLCVDDTKENMKRCISKYGLDPDVFLVNVTHDRSNMIGNSANARQFCRDKDQVFKCMHDTLDQCPGAVELLEYWGHQQNKVETGINLLCDNIGSYINGLDCSMNAMPSVRSCISNSEQSMGSLMTSTGGSSMMKDRNYFRKFCALKMEHVQCDLNAMQSSCPKGVMGLKTEFECSLIPDRCYGLQQQTVSTICNENNYARAERQSSAGLGTNGGSGQNGGNGASTVSTVSYLGALGVALGTVLITIL